MKRDFDWGLSDRVVWEPVVLPKVAILWVSATFGLVVSPTSPILTNHLLIIALYVLEE